MVGVGSLAPPFRLGGFVLEDRTEPVLLAFFKITCPTCQLLFPYLQRLADRAGAAIVGISQDGASGTAEFNEAFGVRFPTLSDPAAEAYPVSNAYGLECVPALFLVEPGRRVSWRSESFVKADLEALASRWGVAIFDASDRVPIYKPG
jgi:peroxiredoxin